MSQNGKITTKENFEINVHNGNVLVYVHDVNNDPDKIKLAIDIVDHLKCKLDDMCDGNLTESDTIPKETLDYINLEYQNFITSKTALTKLAKSLIKNCSNKSMILSYLPSKTIYLQNTPSHLVNLFANIVTLSVRINSRNLPT